MASVSTDPEAVEIQRSNTRQRLTEDEERVLKQCSKEAFWYRSLPLTAAFVSGTLWATRAGYLKPGGTRTAITGVGIFFCYIGGKFSYANQCRQKIQTLIPDSNLAEALREKLEDKSSHRNNEFVLEQSPSQFPPHVPTGQDLHRGEIHSGGQALGLDDSLRPTVDNNVMGISRREEKLKDDRVYTTYEELRKRNREDFRHRRSSLSSKPVDHLEDIQQPAKPPGQKESGFFDKNVTRKKNEYGDDWDD
ncbi:hypothetical protein CHS0354_039997 [Potamilus streckersoni]|uniref:OCIA domain-containing protein n=1 Tax=Potamilus streckersoni TaxID=2493646 RepID=A0AAE0S0H0_9BIVA|nr:hypothetical protein CHS0354_039997 [Potamilus streckersoni]